MQLIKLLCFFFIFLFFYLFFFPSYIPLVGWWRIRSHIRTRANNELLIMTRLFLLPVFLALKAGHAAFFFKAPLHRRNNRRVFHSYGQLHLDTFSRSVPMIQIRTVVPHSSLPLHFPPFLTYSLVCQLPITANNAVYVFRISCIPW